MVVANLIGYDFSPVERNAFELVSAVAPQRQFLEYGGVESPSFCVCFNCTHGQIWKSRIVSVVGNLEPALTWHWTDWLKKFCYEIICLVIEIFFGLVCYWWWCLMLLDNRESQMLLTWSAWPLRDCTKLAKRVLDCCHSNSRNIFSCVHCWIIIIASIAL